MFILGGEMMAVLVVAAAACAGSLVLWSLAKWVRRHAILASSFPHRPRGKHLLAGCASDVLGVKFHRAMEKYANEYGGVVAFRVLNQHVRCPSVACNAIVTYSN